MLIKKGLENKKWLLSDDNKQLDDLMLQIQTNQVTGLQKNEGKPVVDAEQELNKGAVRIQILEGKIGSVKFFESENASKRCFSFCKLENFSRTWFPFCKLEKRFRNVFFVL